MCTRPASGGMRAFSVVVAAAADGGIGRDNSLPWRLKGDMSFFKDITTKAADGRRNAVVMGRKTWESLPPKFRPLPNRLNIVLSRTLSAEDVPAGVVVAKTLEDAVSAGAAHADLDQVLVIGGAEVYREALRSDQCQRIYLTRVHGTFDCDAFFPQVDEATYRLVNQSERHEEGGIQYEFCTYER